jgi:hypothetical protein
MPRESIFLNSTNFVSRNKFTFSFPTSRTFRPGSKVSLVSVNIYNQTFNIKPEYANNTFSIKWIDGTMYNVTIPTGYYTANDLSTFIEYICLTNNLCVFTANQTSPIYFINIKANAVQYKAQIDIVAVPNATLATTLKYEKPNGATWNYPNQPLTPQLILSPGLGRILGFKANLTLPPTQTNVTTSLFSDITPTISPVDNYILTCSLLNSKSNQFSDVMAQIGLGAKGIGEQVEYQCPFLTEFNIQPGVYKTFDIMVFDQNMEPIEIIDKSIGIQLIIESDDLN